MDKEKLNQAPLIRAPELLEAGADTYRQRNGPYGNNYHEIGAQLKAMFPEGLPPTAAAGWNRFAAWFMLFVKVNRYAVNLRNSGKGHGDSAHDAMVYAAMLEELTPIEDGDAVAAALRHQANLKNLTKAAE